MMIHYLEARGPVIHYRISVDSTVEVLEDKQESWLGEGNVPLPSTLLTLGLLMQPQLVILHSLYSSCKMWKRTATYGAIHS